MDNNFTKNLQEWINTPAEKRNLELGAQYLLQLTNNVVLYKNLMRNLKGHAQFIEFRLKRYLKFRLQEITHEQVESMQKQVDVIVKKRQLEKEPTSAAQTEGQQFRSGKRADHEQLPSEIQALYIENASIMQKMRELHLQLRALSTQSSTCPDSDRYPFLKELIELDKRYHNNWKQYDTFAVKRTSGSPTDDNTPSGQIQQSLDEAARLEQKNILRKINLAKGRYKKSPSDKTKESIVSLYQQLTAPSEALTTELKTLGILS